MTNPKRTITDKKHSSKRKSNNDSDMIHFNTLKFEIELN